jgi:hypothetical protein
MNMRHFVGTLRWAVLLCLLFNLCGWSLAQDAGDRLAAGFENPPESARPRVWWHWMNGNITKEGIRLDLEWMKRVGIGGFQNFDAALNTPKLVDKRLVYMTPDWKDTFLYATKLADQLGLEEAIAGSPGWSESGGPWVRPNEAMKKFVWSETEVEGGKPFAGMLPKPPATSGPFQNVPVFDFLALISGQKPMAIPEYYADSAVIGYRAPDGDIPLARLHPRVTSSAGTIDAALLSDGDLVKTIALPMAPVGKRAWIQYEFSHPQVIHAVTLVVAGMRNPFAEPPDPSGNPSLEASDDGQTFRTIATVPRDGADEHTIAFPEVKARFFRMNFLTPPPVAPGGDNIFPPAPSEKAHQIGELVLHAGARVNRFEEKAGVATLPDLYGFPTPPVSDAASIRKADVVDLTAKMQADGTLNWTPAPGRWVVLRMGYSLTGMTNHPASPEGTGLEVDKLSAEHVTSCMNTYLDNYKSAVGDLMGKRGVQYVINDSWEAGTLGRTS